MRLLKSVTPVCVVCLTVLAGCRTTLDKDSAEHFAHIDEIAEAEIEKGSFPGAVVLIGRGNKTLYRRAFGNQIITPEQQAMKAETIFDIASMTKPVATATSIMILRDRGRLCLSDKVSRYIPAFGCEGKEEATIEHLLTHTSGLPAYTNAAQLKKNHSSPCPDKVIEKICSLRALSEPGKDFRYSCLGYITLARIVETVGGKSIDEFTSENIFGPLGMKHTGYTPPDSWKDNIAATEVIEGRALRGTVHDPLARLMGGLSGNAGAFSTADDLAKYCRMLLRGGAYKGKRIITPESVALLTKVVSHGRACGFDVQSGYSWIKGDNGPSDAFCHSGYTGTSIVCNPTSKIYVIVLTNRVHPDDKGGTKTIRKQVAEIAFANLK
ncbi:MAG: beta-lactamase family protein [Sedimentisphaerales bacterium]|nr:beta-lactamase family protein [Sedimentisphaerales bacterium]